MISERTENETVQLSCDVFETNNAQPGACPIIVMHGLFWNKFMFQVLGYSLSKATKRKVFTIDLRNHGESPCCAHCDIYIMTEDVKRFMQDQNLKKVSFVCHSFSSAIPYLIALEKPDAVEKIVMIDHAPFANFSEKIYRENVLIQFNGQNRFLTSFNPKMSLMEAKKKILRLNSVATKGQQCFLRKVAYDLDKVDDEFKWKTDIQFLLDKYKEKAFFVEPRGSLLHEILIVRCNDSVRVNDAKFKDVLRHNPNAKLETIENTTHLLMFEEEDRFIEIVKDFLQTVT